MFHIKEAFLGVLIILFVHSQKLGAQNQSASSEGESNNQSQPWKAMIWQLNDEGTSYVRFGLGSNIWMRYIENNPGTLNNSGEEIGNTFDIGLRRMRLSVTAVLDDKYTVYTQFGVNNQTYVNAGTPATNSDNKKPGLFFHDFWIKRSIIPEYLYLGIGLNAWNGISRLSNVSYIRNFTLDNPTFNFPNIERSDQIGRQLGLFVHGNFKRVNYRFSLAKPFAFDRTASALPNIATEISTENLEYKGYLFYQFIDQEIFITPFTAMSYLGTKTLFNIGFGFDYLPNSTVSKDENGTQFFHDKMQLGLDLFLELPLKRNALLSVYGVGYLYDFGLNYLRSIGIMNVGNGGSLNGNPLAQGGGNTSFSIGTGTITYISAAYMLPTSNKFSERIQPFAAINIRDFQALDEIAFCEHIGLNYLVKGNQMKYSIEYSTRPIYSGIPGTDDHNVIVDRKGLFIFQVQLVL
jgi:hypothetical protein